MTEEEIKIIEERLTKNYFLVRKSTLISSIISIVMALIAYAGVTFEKAKAIADEKVDRLLQSTDYEYQLVDIRNSSSEAKKILDDLRTSIIDVFNEQGEFIIETQVTKEYLPESVGVLSGEAKVKDGYTLIGGGAKSNSGDRPIIMSYPEGHSWVSESYNISKAKTMTVYAIGAKVKLQKKEQPGS